MSVLSDPPVAVSAPVDLEDRLDAQILHVRNEIARLRSQKQKLSATLLGSSKVQKYIQARKSSQGYRNDVSQQQLEEAGVREQKESDTDAHRLAIGVTAFPFTDPAPERRGDPAMLGVRFDLSVPQLGQDSGLANTQDEQVPDLGQEADSSQDDRDPLENDGKHRDTYYIIFRRLQHQNLTYLKVHTNTIPKHIDVEGYAHTYLPLPEILHDGDRPDRDLNGTGEESFEDDSGIDVTQDIQPDTANITTPAAAGAPSSSTTGVSISGTGQSLHTFIHHIRDDLHSWHYRTCSIRYLQHSLTSPSSASKYDISELTQLTNDATTLRVAWINSTLALLKISYDGDISRAVVYGERSNPSASRADGENGEYGNGAENESEISNLSEYEAGNDRNIVLAQKAKYAADNVRLPEWERILVRDERGEKVRIGELEGRLKVLKGRGLLK